MLGVFKIKAGKGVGSFMDSDPLLRPGFIQMIIMGLVDMFSALCGLMKVCCWFVACCVVACCIVACCVVVVL